MFSLIYLIGFLCFGSNFPCFECALFLTDQFWTICQMFPAFYFSNHFIRILCLCKLQARRKRGAEGALAPPVFGRTVNPISTRGSRLCPPQYYEPPRIFRPCDGPARQQLPGDPSLNFLAMSSRGRD